MSPVGGDDAGATRRELLLGGASAVAVGSARGASLRAPLVFGHRGASALRPEHTIASYLKAIEDGADYVEPDLCCTRDGVLIARHENNIADTTDIGRRPEFACLRTEKTVDGQRQTGWFVEDLTLAEIRQLRAIERLPALRPANAAMDGRFPIPTWTEIVDVVAGEARRRGRSIGLIPELKHSTYFAGIGLPLEDRFLATIARHAYLRHAPPAMQSFEIGNLRHLRAKLGRLANLRLVQLVDTAADRPADVAAVGGSLTYAAMIAPDGLRAMARYADIAAPGLRAIIPVGADGRLGLATTLVADAHRAGVMVTPWTFRPENHFLAADFRDGNGDATRNAGGSIAEMRAYLATGIDGFFTDDPGLGRGALRRAQAEVGRERQTPIYRSV